MDIRSWASRIVSARLSMAAAVVLVVGHPDRAAHAQPALVVWTNGVNVTITDELLRKTGGCDGCFDAGATSEQQITSGDGYVEFTIGELGTVFVAGLSHGNSGTGYDDVDFAFRFNGAGAADVLQNGAYVGGDTAYAVGDVFRVAVVGSRVQYSRNGVVLLEQEATVQYPLLLDTSLASLDATVRYATIASVSPPESGGFIEKAGSQTYRSRFTTSEIAAFLPPNGAKGPFRFPAPYSTEAVRLTDASDCAGGADCLWYLGYSYWRNINNHLGSDTMYILLGFDRNRGGGGPGLIAYNKVTEAVQNLGPLFPADSPYSYSTAEGWYFSGSMPTRLYTFLPGGTTLWRYDVSAKQFESAPAMDLKDCPRPGVCPSDAAFIYQPHSSDDDRVHSATVQDSAYGRLGCVVSGPGGFGYFAVRSGYTFDECHVDKSGRWLVLLETAPDGKLDNRIVDLADGTVTTLADVEGSLGHLDTGHGYALGGDNYNALPNATILLKFPPASTERPLGPVVHYNKRWDIVAANHPTHGNAIAGRSPEEQYACGSNASRVADMADEIICFPLNAYRNADGTLDVLVVGQVMTDLDAAGGGDLDGDDYEQMPKGNLDITGRYFVWTTNLGGDRLDAFLVKVPAELLDASNHAPVAADKSATTPSGTPVTLTLSATDLESCELAFSIASTPASGSLGGLGDEPCAAGSPNTDTARVTYTPAAGFSGSDSFTYVAGDGALTASATVTIEVQAPEPPPSAGLAVSGIQPASVSQGTGLVSFTITGSGFAPGADVIFEKGDGPAPRVRGVSVVSPTELSASVEIRSGGPPRDRFWDVRVTNPDGVTAVGSQLLRVTP